MGMGGVREMLHTAVLCGGENSIILLWEHYYTVVGTVLYCSHEPFFHFEHPLEAVHSLVGISSPKTCRSSTPEISVEHSPSQPFSWFTPV